MPLQCCLAQTSVTEHGRVNPKRNNVVATEYDTTRYNDGDIREELSRLEQDSRFRAGPRARKVLRYVVQEEVAGRGERIKALSIAIDALGFTGDFTSKNDAAVRAEATRVRRALANYYTSFGSEAPLEIRLPRGTYRPQFVTLSFDASQTETPQTPEAAHDDVSPPKRERLCRDWRGFSIAALIMALLITATFWALTARADRNLTEYPTIVISQQNGGDMSDPGTLMVESINHALIVKLSDFSGIRVVVGETAAQADQILSNLPDSLNRSVYRFDSVVRQKGADWEYEWTVVGADTKSIIAADTVTLDSSVSGGTPEEEIAEDISRRLADRHGVIELQEQRKSTYSLTDRPCILRAYNYYTLIKYDDPISIASCLEAIVAAEPRDADAWGLLAYMNVAAVRHMNEIAAEADTRLKRALEASQRAIEQAPDSSQAHLMRAVTVFQTGELEAFVTEASLARTLNPASVLPLFVTGNRLYQIGHYEEGLALIRHAYEINPTFPNSNKINMLMELYRTGRYEEAIARDASGEWDKGQYAAPMVMTAVYGQMGDQKRAALETEKLIALWPTVGADVKQWVRTNRMLPELANKLLVGLTKAGILVD